MKEKIEKFNKINDNKNKYLSDYDKGYIRNLFIERLINECQFIITKEFMINNDSSDVDYKKFNILRLFMDTASLKVRTYSEIVLAMTSEELEDIPDILTALGYNKEIYIKFQNIIEKYKSIY